MPRNAKALADEIEEVWARADREGRDLTPGERAQMEQMIEAAKSQHSVERQIKELGAALGGPLMARMGDGSPAFGGQAGDVFIQSKQYQQIKDPGGRGQTWTTGPVEVAKGLPQMLVKGTLLENVGGAGP